MAFTAHAWLEANFTCVELTKMSELMPCNSFFMFTQSIDFADSAKRTKNLFNTWTACDRAT
jgi:hypothetical protein